MKILRTTEFRIFLTVWLVYIFFISGYGGNWMANSMIGLSASIVDDHTFSIDKYVKGNEDNAFFKGHYYSGFAPGASFLAAPLYFIFKPVFMLVPEGIFGYPSSQVTIILLNIAATIFITALLAALTSVLVYKFLDNFTKKESAKIIITMIFSFSTLYFLYATTFDAKIIATFFSFAAFYILFKMKKGKNLKNSYIFYSGLLLGFAVTIEYSEAIALAVLSVYLLTFLRNKKIILFVIGALIPLLLLLAYNQAVFGNPLTNPYAYRASESLLSGYNQGFGLGAAAFYGLSFSPFRGFFFYMPVMLMSLYGLYCWFKSKRNIAELFVVLSLFVLFFLYNASMKSELFWSAGCSFGPRHLLPIIPFFVLPLAFVMGKIGRFIVLILGGLSFLINLLPNLYGVTHLWTYRCTDANPIIPYLQFIFQRGVTNYTLNLVKEKISDISVITINLIVVSSIIVLVLITYKIWKRN